MDDLIYNWLRDCIVTMTFTELRLNSKGVYLKAPNYYKVITAEAVEEEDGEHVVFYSYTDGKSESLKRLTSEYFDNLVSDRYNLRDLSLTLFQRM